jgi:hypothetical protein
MRKRFLLLVLAASSAAFAADATPSGRMRPVEQPPKTAPGKTSTPALASAVTSVAADPAECRIACADSYYVCRTAPRPDDCAPAWSQCVAGCELPNLDVAASARR